MLPMIPPKYLISFSLAIAYNGLACLFSDSCKAFFDKSDNFLFNSLYLLEGFIELFMSWTTLPNFVFALGASLNIWFLTSCISCSIDARLLSTLLLFSMYLS